MWQVLKTGLFVMLGSVPGMLLVAILGNGFLVNAIIVGVLGGIVGFGLSLPGTSVSRVAKGTAASILAHNAPMLSTQIHDALLGDSEAELRKKEESAAQEDFRKLPKCDWVTVTNLAAGQIDLQRPANVDGWPLRLIAEINPDAPHFLKYTMFWDSDWDPSRDFYCPSNGIHFIFDGLSARRLKGTSIDFENGENVRGFTFFCPGWPRQRLDKEPWEVESIKTPIQVNSTIKLSVAAVVALAVVVGFVRNLPKAARVNPGVQDAQMQPPAQSLASEEDEWNEKMKRGEDVPEAILILGGIDPAKYKDYQAQLKAQAEKGNKEKTVPATDQP